MNNTSYLARLALLVVVVTILAACTGGKLELAGNFTGCLSNSQCPLGHICLPDGTCELAPGVVQLEVLGQIDGGEGDVTPEVEEGDLFEAEAEACIPEDETCDGEDNDCDGVVDNPPEDPDLSLCDNPNPCIVGTCKGGMGCQFDSLTAVDCDDGNACTLNDMCDDGVCMGEFDECDDSNSCTDDSCDKETGCAHEKLDGEGCWDGDFCTINKLCVDGECLGDPMPCDDFNPCTDDDCEPETGCINTNNYEPCDDGDPCTVDDQCDAGSCTGFAVPCQCLTDADCEAMEDGNLCNGTLFCNFSTFPFSCTVDPLSIVSCPEPEGPDAGCLEPACDPATGICSFAAVNEGGECEDGNLCTKTGTCQEGNCTVGGATNCYDDNPCTTDSCQPAVGCLNVFNSAPCNDGDACTAPDMCQEGDCVGKEPVDCDDNDDCTEDSCDVGLGCLNVDTTGNACEDGSACTIADTCDTGICVPGAPPDCDDQEVCTDDSCDPSSGCVNAPNAIACDDGNACTTADSCGLGACIGGPALDCDDGNACTADPCDMAAGCQHEDISTDCDDANTCTTDSCDQVEGCINEPVADGEVCAEGKCYLGQCCAPLCAGKECGDDWCGGVCGECDPGMGCEVGICVQAVPELAWVSIAGGQFWMGCPSGICADPDEYPSHPVALQPFDILKTEVTEEQFEIAMGLTPSCSQSGAEFPVECVAWADAEEFCQRIGARLPTEAEWEFALRGDSSTIYICGDEESCLADSAWYADNSGAAKQAVGGKLENSGGLHDMSGNVREWVYDCYHQTYDGAPTVGYPPWDADCTEERVVRGGGYLGSAESCSVAAREGVAADTGDGADIGFRCARSK